MDKENVLPTHDYRAMVELTAKKYSTEMVNKWRKSYRDFETTDEKIRKAMASWSLSM